MEAYIFTSTLREFLRARRLAAWVFVVIALYGIAFLYRFVMPGGTPASDQYVLLADVLVFRVLPLAAAIFSTAIVAQEVEQKTIVYLLTRPVPRWKLLLFKTLAAMIVVFLISAASAVVVSLATSHGFNAIMLRDIPALAIGSAAYLSVFVFLSLVMNRSMIVCLLFAFVWETSVANLRGDMYRLTISSYLTGIAKHPEVTTAHGLMDALSGITGGNSIAPSTGWIAMSVLTVLALVAGCYWFSTFEFSPREDAG